MKLAEELTVRGFIHQHTGDSVSELFDGAPRTIYHGIDPTADSAHVGNMVVWLLLRHLVKAGHRVIFLVGGGTGMIGDPKPDAERVLSDEKEVSERVQKIMTQAQRLVGGDTQTVTFVNNKEWLSQVSLIAFLRDIGKHFTVNELVKKDAIAKRLQSDVGISYTEFAYPLLQAYDYLTLHREYGCDVQVGGSDQWGNIVSGVDLVRRVEQAPVHALTVPLIIDKATGKKFGKSEGNAVWLDAEKTSPFSFYQFWLNVSDESVEDYLRIFTMLSLTEIEEVIAAWQKDPAARLAQRTLAYAVTEFVHGDEVAKRVERVTACVFGDRSVSELSQAEIELLSQHIPHQVVAADTQLVEVVVATGLASSKREARTFITSGAIYINGETCVDVAATLVPYQSSYVLLKRGKKQTALLKVN